MEIAEMIMREVFPDRKYCREGIDNLCTAIILSAVKDVMRGDITQEEFRAFIFSEWAYFLMRGNVDADVIYNEVVKDEIYQM